jgi:Collagen triple helix repeat (20 copies)
VRRYPTVWTRTIHHPLITPRMLLAALIVAGGALAGAALSSGQNGGQRPAAQRATLCAHTTTGALRIVAAGRRCPRRHRVVPVPAAGPRGIAGRRGADGRAGAAGATGASGPQGARGPMGSKGIDGLEGLAGTFDFDSFQGMPCDDGAPGTILLTYESDGKARFAC